MNFGTGSRGPSATSRVRSSALVTFHLDLPRLLLYLRAGTQAAMEKVAGESLSPSYLLLLAQLVSSAVLRRWRPQLKCSATMPRSRWARAGGGGGGGGQEPHVASLIVLVFGGDS